MFKVIVSSALVLSSICAFTGCHRDEPARTADGTTIPASGKGSGVGVDESVVTSIANARCDRETKCNNVGSGKTYVNETTCREDIRAKTRNDLNAQDCPNGIMQKALDECMADIRAESCGNPFDSLSRLASCRTGALCR